MVSVLNIYETINAINEELLTSEEQLVAVETLPILFSTISAKVNDFKELLLFVNSFETTMINDYGLNYSVLAGKLDRMKEYVCIYPNSDISGHYLFDVGFFDIDESFFKDFVGFTIPAGDEVITNPSDVGKKIFYWGGYYRPYYYDNHHFEIRPLGKTAEWIGMKDLHRYNSEENLKKMINYIMQVTGKKYVEEKIEYNSKILKSYKYE